MDNNNDNDNMDKDNDNNNKSNEDYRRYEGGSNDNIDHYSKSKTMFFWMCSCGERFGLKIYEVNPVFEI